MPTTLGERQEGRESVLGPRRSEFGRAIVERHLASVLTVAVPESIAGAVCWLASDESANVNGAVPTSDGGWSAV